MRLSPRPSITAYSADGMNAANTDVFDFSASNLSPVCNARVSFAVVGQALTGAAPKFSPSQYPCHSPHQLILNSGPEVLPPLLPAPRIALIVAVARNGTIGRDGGLPWRMPSDLKTFRRLTMGKPMVMGRRTFASLGKPLDGRDNLVVTRDASFSAPGIEVFLGLEPALIRARDLAAARHSTEIMVIGGGELYRTALPVADRLYWTEIDADIDGDTSFPAFDLTEWRETAREPIPQGPRDDFAAILHTLDRASASS